MREVLAGVLLLFLIGNPRAVVEAQAPNATLRVTVVDSTGAVLPGAMVTVAGLDPANKEVAREPVKAGADGVAVVPKLLPGRYSVQAEFAGFETRKLPEIRVRSGDNRQVLLLPVEGFKEAVLVGQDKQQAAADPRGPAFGTTLTREQLDALSDDPDVLRQQLQDMAGPGAVIKVDSFEGGALPPKAQIRSIRISRDSFAAEYHSAGGTQIEIITQPGMGALRMNVGYRMRGGGLTGRSPFTPTRGPEQNRNVTLAGGGTLIKNKASFNVFFQATDAYETPNINVALGSGQTRSEALAIKAPRDNYFATANVDYAISLDHTLRLGGTMNKFDNRNLGIGQYDQEERAFSTVTTTGFFRAQQIGPLGRRGFVRTRLQYGWSDSNSTSATEAATIRVNDAFNSGGAQVRGGQHTKTLTAGSDLDYVRGIHSFRTGIQIDATAARSNDSSNYLGTYTFESLEAFTLGQPRSYSRRIGDPNLDYRNVQGAIYLQDDVRVRRNLTLSAGARYEVQTHVHDANNIAPRFGVTFAPGAAGQTTLRASWGIFYDWLPLNTYEQALRIDGLRQQEIDVNNPPYPDPLGLTATASPVNRYLLGNYVQLAQSTRVSVGIDRRLASWLQSSATYAHTRGGNLLRGLNQNAPVAGVRPDARFGNVVEVVADAQSRQNQLQVNLTANQGALFPQGRNAPRISVKRITVFLNYTLASLRNNTEGAFSLAPLGDQAFEWGPANNDLRHRLNVSLNNQIVKNLNVGINVNVSSGSPYTIRTGRDDNGDLVFNDRPAGIERNSERGASHLTLNANLGYGFTFGPPVGGPAGIGVIMTGGAPTVQSFEQGQRFRIQFFVNAQNLTNRANYTGYSGTLTSPFYGRATSVAMTRRVDTGINFSF